MRDVIDFRISHFCTNAKNTILIIKTPGGILIGGAPCFNSMKGLRIRDLLDFTVYFLVFIKF